MESSESKRSRRLGYAHRRRRKTRSLMVQGRVKKGCSRAHRENVRESNAKIIHRLGCILLLGCAHRGVPNKGIIIGLAAAALRRESRTKRRCAADEEKKRAGVLHALLSVSLSLPVFCASSAHVSLCIGLRICIESHAIRASVGGNGKSHKSSSWATSPYEKGFWFYQSKKMLAHTIDSTLSKKKSCVASISELSFSTLALNGTARCLLPVIVFVVGAIYRSI